MNISAKTLFSTSLVAAALVVSAPAFAQSNVSTDSSTTTDTTTAAGMKGQDSVRPADSTMGETTVQKRSDVDGAKSGTTQSIDSTRSSSSSTTDDSQK